MIPFEWDGWRLLVLLVLFMLIAAVIMTEAFKRDYKKIAQFLIAVILLPLGLNFNFLMYGASSTHSLHMYQGIMLFITFFILSEHAIKNVTKVFLKKNILQKSFQWVQGCVLAVALIFGILYVRYDNMCYMLLEMRQESAIRYFTTLITRIESTEGFSSEYEIVYINEYEKENLSDRILTDYDYPVTNPFNMDLVNAYNWQRFVEYWCGFDMVNGDSTKFEDNEVVKEMPGYPDDGSIRILDDTIVVKF